MMGGRVWWGRYKSRVSGSGRVIPSHGINCLAFPAPLSLLPALEDGTDTWFRNVGILHIDAGETPKRTYTEWTVFRP